MPGFYRAIPSPALQGAGCARRKYKKVSLLFSGLFEAFPELVFACFKAPLGPDGILVQDSEMWLLWG